LDCIEEQIEEYKEILSRYFTIELPSSFTSNPLYSATNHVEKELLRCPDTLTNETQMRPLLEYSNTPFYCLTVKKNWKELDQVKNSNPMTVKHEEERERRSSAPSSPMKSPKKTTTTTAATVTTPTKAMKNSRKFSEIIDDYDSSTSTPKKMRRRIAVK
jgi:hypothetical protein